MVRINALMDNLSANLHDFLHIIDEDLTKPQKKFLKDGMVGLLRSGRPIVCRMARNLVAEYEYDGRKRRIEEDVAGESGLDNYYNDNWQLLEVRKNGDADPQKQFVWDQRYIDAPIVRFRDGDTDGTIDDTLYYTNDANFNVTALVDTDGDVVERYAYDPYGQVTVLNGADGTDPDVDGSTVFEWDVDADGASDADNQVLYAGYNYDPETGLYHVRNRSYHPTLGRWMQRDPIGYADRMSLYEYVVSAPTAIRDSSGLAGSISGPGFEGYCAALSRGKQNSGSKSNAPTPPPNWDIEVPSDVGSGNGAPNTDHDRQMMNECYNRSAYHWNRGEIEANRYWWDQFKKWEEQLINNLDSLNTGIGRVRQWLLKHEDACYGRTYHKGQGPTMTTSRNLPKGYQTPLDEVITRPRLTALGDYSTSAVTGHHTGETTGDIIRSSTPMASGSDVSDNPRDAMAGAIEGVAKLAKGAGKEALYGISRVHIVGWVKGDCWGFYVNDASWNKPKEKALNKDQAESILRRWAHIHISDRCTCKH